MDTSFQQKIKQDLVESMRAKDSVRTTVLRSLIAGFTNELVTKGMKPQDPISDEDGFRVLERAVKQRKDAMQQFIGGGRADLAENEKSELAILEIYLPKMMSQDEIRDVAVAKQAEMGGIDPAKAGQFMGMLMKALKGKARGDDVKAVVDTMLSK